MKPWSRASIPAPPSLPAPVPAPTEPPTEDLQKNEVVNIQQMCKLPFNCSGSSFNLNLWALGLGIRGGTSRSGKYSTVCTIRKNVWKLDRTRESEILCVEAAVLDYRKKTDQNWTMFYRTYSLCKISLMLCSLYLLSTWSTLTVCKPGPILQVTLWRTGPLF